MLHLIGVTFGFCPALDLLDDLDLGAVGGLEEANAPAARARGQLLQDPHSVRAETRERGRVVVVSSATCSIPWCCSRVCPSTMVVMLSVRPCRFTRYPRVPISATNVAPKLSM